VTGEWLQCIGCSARYPIQEIRYACDCGNLLAVERPPEALSALHPSLFDARANQRAPIDKSGVWRFREAVLDIGEHEIVTHPEGGTRLYSRPQLSAWAGIEHLSFKHEGENPTGSFKDRGMTVGMTQPALRPGIPALRSRPMRPKLEKRPLSSCRREKFR
jgi:threonine synthase